MTVLNIGMLKGQLSKTEKMFELTTRQILALWDCRLGWLPSQSVNLE